uniref:non-specific serine/threonine protein kinase n=1 Tax=Strigamia maritima TaxID=126957 RepID=T1IJZ0_STRMM
MSKPIEEYRENFIEEQQEDPKLYCFGGYHPVHIGGTFCSRYIVCSKLGWGTFSTVWKCWDQRDQRYVALKILRSESKIGHASLLEMKLLEHSRDCAVSASQKGKVVQLLDRFMFSGVNGTHVCMVFEIVGISLFQLLRRFGNPGIPLTTVKSIMRQVLEALDYLHVTCGIIHTDIKPENICVVENSTSQYSIDPMTVTIADLGSAIWADSHNSCLIQTSSYRAPEVLLELEFGPKVDIWSAACMAYALATGYFLFPASSDDLSEAEVHLARIVCVVGDVPKEMAFSCRRSRKIFTFDGKLRCFPDIKCEIFELLTKKCKWNSSEAHRFAEFLLPMLAIDPDKRVSAKDALKHPWLHI